MFIAGGFVIPLGIILSLVFGDCRTNQFLVPGREKVVIEEPGRYYLWNDYQTIFEGRAYNRSEEIPNGFQIRIIDSESGERLDFVSDNSIYSTSGGSSKKAIGYVDVKRPCTVWIETAGVKERVFSFSEFNFWRLLGLIVGGCFITMLVALVAIGIIIWGVVKVVHSGKRESEGKAANVSQLRC